MLSNRFAGLCGKTILSKRHGVITITVLVLLWLFYLYCRGLGDIEVVDMSENGLPSNDPHDIIGIDSAHLRAKRHRGCWIFVVNEYHQFLFVKRKENAKTCPSTWSVIGEHTHPGESYDNCAKRALKEEISVLKYNNLVPMEESPVFFHLDYGARVDKQWTKLYLVTVSKSVLRKSDIHENDDFTWVNFTEADHWLHQCPNGICRYCNPSKVWKMSENLSFSYYYSFIEMTVEYLHMAMVKHENTTAT